MLRLAKLAIGTAGQPLREVHFEGTIGPSYVEATNEQVQKLVQQFLGTRASTGPRGEAKARPGRKPRRRAPVQGVVKDEADGKDQALRAVQAGAGKRLPVYYPTVRTSESYYRQPPRVYRVKDEDGKIHQAYRMVLTRGELLGENYGMQGITWKDAPILREPQETRTIGKRTYELHYDGDRLRLVAWRTPKAAYWISNTLLLSLTNRQMMAIARSARTL